MRRLLVTGFGRFPGAPANPTQALVAALARRRRPALVGIELITAVLPVTWAGAPAQLRALIAAHRPDAVLMFGLAGRARRLRLETRAVNRGEGLRADAAGQVHMGPALECGGPSARLVRGPMMRLHRAIAETGAPVALSRNAGTYLCNAALWTALAATPKDLPVAFIHVPPLVRRRPKAPGRRPGLDFAVLVTAAVAAMIALRPG